MKLTRVVAVIRPPGLESAHYVSEFDSWADSHRPAAYPDFASGWRGVQSFGGKTTRQNVGLGSINSTPT